MKCGGCSKDVGLKLHHIDGDRLCKVCFVERCKDHVLADVCKDLQGGHHRQDELLESIVDIEEIDAALASMDAYYRIEAGLPVSSAQLAASVIRTMKQ